MQTLTPQDYQTIASQLKALSCAARLRIVELLLHDNGEGRVNIDQMIDATGLSQGVVSNHVNKLCKAGLVAPCEKRGHYIACPDRINAVMRETEQALGIGEVAQVEEERP